MKRLFYILSFIFVFFVSFIMFSKVSFASTSFSYQYDAVYNNTPAYVVIDWEFTSNDIKACSYLNVYNNSPTFLYFEISYKNGLQAPNGEQSYSTNIHYIQNTNIYSKADNSLLYTWSLNNAYVNTSDLYIYYQDGNQYYCYRVSEFYSNIGYDVGSIANTVSGIPLFDNRTACWEYLFFGGTDAPDFSDYEYSQYMTGHINGYPLGAGLDFGSTAFQRFAFHYYGGIDNVVSNKAYIRFIGKNGDTYLIPELDNLGQFYGNERISSIIAPDSNLYVLLTPYNDVTMKYGDTYIIECPIKGSIIGNIIRSFGGSDNNYYNSTLNVNNTEIPVEYIGSTIQYKYSNNPNEYNYNFLNTSNKDYYTTSYYPVFNNYDNITNNDYDFIDNNYNDTDIKVIEDNTETTFNFNININDLSSNDIQKVVDDTQDLFGLVGNLFPLIASMFALTFPFLMFDIPGAILVIGGILAGGALVGLGIKFINFIRGGNS